MQNFWYNSTYKLHFPFSFFPDLCASIEKEAACSGPSIQWQLKSHLLMTFYLMDFFTLFASKCLISFYKQISKSLFHFKIPRHPKYTKKLGFNQYFQRQKCFLKICKINLLQNSSLILNLTAETIGNNIKK